MSYRRMGNAIAYTIESGKSYILQGKIIRVHLSNPCHPCAKKNKK